MYLFAFPPSFWWPFLNRNMLNHVISMYTCFLLCLTDISCAEKKCWKTIFLDVCFCFVFIVKIMAFFKHCWETQRPENSGSVPGKGRWKVCSPVCPLQQCRHPCEWSKRRSILNSWRGPWETEEEDLTFGHKQSSGSVQPETAAETTEELKHWSRTRVQTSEKRSQEEDEGSKGRVDWGVMQERRKGNDVRKQQGDRQHPQGISQ